MTSQLDLDQGGTFRQLKRVYLGPSVGWVQYPDIAILRVTTGGVIQISRGTTVVMVAFNGAVTIALPPARATPVGAQVIPMQFAITPTIIMDVGPFASAQPFTITPGDGTIDGLASINIASDYGVRILQPDIVNGGYTVLQ